MVKDLNTQKMSFRKKLFLIIKSRFVSFLINRVNERAFCLLLNFLFKTDGPIEFENNKYIKTTTNSKIYFPNKRILRIFINTQTQLDRIFKEYCLDKINFKDGDTVLDCGANVGELFLSLNTKNIQTNYIGFEPDIETYNCLTLNTKNNKPSELFNVALSNKTEKQKIYFDNEGGNTSLINFGSKESKIINTITLDSLKIKNNIKLFKIDAEGFELEVLHGAKKTLKNIDYISVDIGFEKGFEQESTLVEVTNYLYENNFSFYQLSETRLIGLFKNNKIDE